MSLSPADRYERAIAHYINTLGEPSLKAKRPKVGTSYSDLYIEYKNKKSWVEVKMNEADQMGTPRVSFNGNKWVATKMGPIQKVVCGRLNFDESTNFIVELLKEYTNSHEIVIPTTKGGLNHPNAVSLYDMESFLANRETAYIYESNEINLSHVVIDHYTWGKAEPAHYLSAGDNFYMLGEENPLGLVDIPPLTGFGKLKVRISLRSEFYEIMPEIKLRNMESSPYSLAPGSDKQNPFTKTRINI